MRSAACAALRSDSCSVSRPSLHGTTEVAVVENEIGPVAIDEALVANPHLEAEAMITVRPGPCSCRCVGRAVVGSDPASS